MLESGSAVLSTPCQAQILRDHRKQIQTTEEPGPCPALISATTVLGKWGNWGSAIH